MARRHPFVALAAVLALGLTACSATSTGGSGTTAASASPCPADPVRIVVSVEQWGDIVQQLAGGCGEVTTIVTGSSGDPHDYEPTPTDVAAFGRAALVVVNGQGYDEWARQAVDAADPRPAVVDAAEVVGLAEGANPHLWYDPAAVHRVADAVTSRLRALVPAEQYLDDQARSFRTSMRPYDDGVAATKAKVAGTRYLATEGVFDDMADALGMANVTPQGYRQAAANGSEPSPGDVAAFERLLEQKQADVLVDNAQTQGALSEQLRRTAERAGVPVVSVTETVPAGASSFVAWQVGQLQTLVVALGV